MEFSALFYVLDANPHVENYTLKLPVPLPRDRELNRGYFMAG